MTQGDKKDRAITGSISYQSGKTSTTTALIELIALNEISFLNQLSLLTNSIIDSSKLLISPENLALGFFEHFKILSSSFFPHSKNSHLR